VSFMSLLHALELRLGSVKTKSCYLAADNLFTGIQLINDSSRLRRCRYSVNLYHFWLYTCPEESFVIRSSEAESQICSRLVRSQIHLSFYARKISISALDSPIKLIDSCVLPLFIRSSCHDILISSPFFLSTRMRAEFLRH
jgi:hypothetical protein